METHCIPHSELDLLPALVRDYLTGFSSMSQFAAFSPDMEGVEEAVTKRTFGESERATLVQVLSGQAGGSKYATELVKKQIQSLGSENTFTVTTGHQLCLYGGPMFFLYKILSALHLANKLKERFPEKHFVPVYWMASEDHDFPEVNHIWLRDRKLEWNTAQTGKVGAFKLDGIERFHEQVQETLGFPLPQKTLEELRKIYSPAKTLAEATRDFAYWVFAEQGLVVIDPDDARLKGIFEPVMRRELETSFSQQAVQSSNDALQSKGYKIQVSPRGINLFYLGEGKRERLVETEEGFALADGSKRWEGKVLFSELESNPEKFSPNVVLRPVYQECILPNIAYIGGPGELSYWLQLKEAFADAGVFFPAVVLRDMFYLFDQKTGRKVRQTGLAHKDLFLSEHAQFKKALKQVADHEGAIDKAKDSLEKMYGMLAVRAEETDKTLKKAVEARKHKALKEMDALGRQFIRSEKRKNSELLQRIEDVHRALFFNNVPRERIDNWLNHSANPSELANSLLETCNPFNGVKLIELE